MSPTLGELRFSSMRREVYVQNEDGTRSDVVKATYPRI